MTNDLINQLTELRNKLRGVYGFADGKAEETLSTVTEMICHEHHLPIPAHCKVCEFTFNKDDNRKTCPQCGEPI